MTTSGYWSSSANWMNNFAVALMVPSMEKASSWGLYLFFAEWLFLGVFFVYFFVPETRGKTLEEMDAVFESQTSNEDIAELRKIQQEVGLLSLLGVQNEMSGDMKGLEVHEAVVNIEKE